jgi:hypothetical protein
LRDRLAIWDNKQKDLASFQSTTMTEPTRAPQYIDLIDLYNLVVDAGRPKVIVDVRTACLYKQHFLRSAVSIPVIAEIDAGVYTIPPDVQGNRTVRPNRITVYQLFRVQIQQTRSTILPTVFASVLTFC